MARKLLGMSRPLRIRRPLAMPVTRMISRPDAVAAAFDYEPEKPLPVPAGACRNYGQELPADFVCPRECPCVHECFEAYTRMSR